MGVHEAGAVVAEAEAAAVAAATSLLVATALVVTAEAVAVSEVAGYTSRRVRVLALKLTAAQKLRCAQCGQTANERDRGEADPSHRGAGMSWEGDTGTGRGWVGRGNEELNEPLNMFGDYGTGGSRG
jgi:hypothetical protein